MKAETFALIYGTIMILPPEWGAQAEGEALEAYYRRNLKNIPENIAMTLRAAIEAKCQKRPTVARINELLEEIHQRHPESRVADALEEVLRMRRTLGARCKRDGLLVPNVNGFRHEGWAIPNMVYGTPDFSDPLTGPTIGSMGGWREFCEGDAPLGVLTGQFRALFLARLRNEGDDATQRLRLEYRQELAALPAPAPEEITRIPAPPEPRIEPPGGMSAAGAQRAPADLKTRQWVPGRVVKGMGE